jgi:hypothetical protein
MEGSDDRLLEATVRQSEPAPAPWDMRLAATSIVPPFPPQPGPVGTQRYASAAPSYMANDASPGPDPAQPMSYADPSSDTGGTAMLSGRGLY